MIESLSKKKLKFNLLTAFLFIVIIAASWFCFLAVQSKYAQDEYDEFCRTARLLPTTNESSISEEVRALRMPPPEDDSF